MLGELIFELLSNHRGKFFGMIIGLAFGILVVVLGFLQTLFLACCIYLGYIIGKRIDDNESLKDAMNRVFRDR